MTESGPWVCGVCRSVNRDVDSRCYSCRTPRAMALDPRAADPSGPRDPSASTPTAQAASARSLGARFRASGGLAAIVQVAVLVVTAITLARTVLLIVLLRGLEDQFAAGDLIDPTAAGDQVVALGLLQYVMLGAWFLGLVAWGAWLARVVANVPALGGGWPNETPRFAFISTLIPGGNLYWSTSTLRQAIVALSPAGQPRVGLITAWWLAVTPALILLLNIGPLRWLRSIITTVVSAILLILSGGDVTTLVDASILVEIVGAALILTAAFLAVLLVQLVESLQAQRLAGLPATAAAGPEAAAAS